MNKGEIKRDSKVVMSDYLEEIESNKILCLQWNVVKCLQAQVLLGPHLVFQDLNGSMNNV